MDGRLRVADNEVNAYPRENHPFQYDDTRLPKPQGFYQHEGQCYFIDSSQIKAGSHRGTMLKPAVFQLDLKYHPERSYRGRGARGALQVVERSCRRDVPFEVCIEGTDEPIKDTDGDVHPNDVRPTKAFDFFGRIVTLQFEKMKICSSKGPCSSGPEETLLITKLYVKGPKGYCMIANHPGEPRWNTAYDNLDGFRDTNLGAHEDFDALVDLEKMEGRIRLRCAQIDSQGVARIHWDGKAVELDYRGQPREHTRYSDTFSRVAKWYGVKGVKEAKDLPSDYFEKDHGIINFGQNSSKIRGGVVTHDNRPTGLSNVTFSDTSKPAYSIVGPVFEHLFIRKKDLVTDMEEFLRANWRFPNTILKEIIRRAFYAGRTHWTHFRECFEVPQSWKLVCGPIRKYLEDGGRLDDTEAVTKALDGASENQIKKLLERARANGLLCYDDFDQNDSKFKPNSF